MLNKELIPILAEIWGVPFETAWTIDRSLADAGFRRKWKGPRPPHMTRREALHFLIACMVTRHATKAGEEAAPMIRATGPIMVEPGRAVDLEDWEDDDHLSERVELHRALSPLLDAKKISSGAYPLIGLVDALLAVCHLIQERILDPWTVTIESSFTSDTTEIAFLQSRTNATVETMHFFTDRITPAKASGDVTVMINFAARIHGEALLAIVARTIDPMAPDAPPEADWKGAT